MNTNINLSIFEWANINLSKLINKWMHEWMNKQMRDDRMNEWIS